MAKPPLLFLVHRIPYPPNKGDKIRSHHLLRFLAERYRVFLGTFVDDEADRTYVRNVEEVCERVFAGTLSPLRGKLSSLAALPAGEPMSVRYYRSPKLTAWVERTLRQEGIRRAVVFSSQMAPYVIRDPALRSVVDFVDVDSEKWRQYAERQPWPWSWIYRREGTRLLELEREVAARAKASVFVTPEERDLFLARSGVPGERVFSIVNGVDTDYFSPEPAYPSPYEGGGPVVVFTGMMDYWANVDAVEWFARESFGRVREAVPGARFFIVGARPARAVEKLAALPGVVVTGRVGDVRPYLAHAAVSVAPMRIARGIQNKVLEALAMARPVVATRAAVEGLTLPEDLRANVAGAPDELAEKVVRLLQRGDVDGVGEKARRWVRAQHDWSETLRGFEPLIEGR